MRFGNTWLNAGWLTLALTLVPVPALAQAAQETGRQTDRPPGEEEPFWPAWNQFVRDVTESSIHTDPDPWEPVNRRIFAFNDTADRWVLKPLARGYRWVTPDPVETGIGNVFSNLLEVTTIANDLLQGKFGQAASDTGRFLINSTVGLAGVFDVATPLGLERHNEDFGQTLGYWGVGSGPYVVVPFLGAYTLRSGAGGITENLTTDVIHYIDHIPTRNTAWGTRLVDNRASLLTAEELISGDRYTFIRDSYLQQREYLVNDGQVEDTFGEEEYNTDWEEWEDL